MWHEPERAPSDVHQTSSEEALLRLLGECRKMRRRVIQRVTERHRLSEAPSLSRDLGVRVALGFDHVMRHIEAELSRLRR